ncbi:wax ester synthase-like Acyl-CoA acyltransferase domain protein [Mycobacterium kansasii 824]|nr:wax ester synthase-like Acyl-CoA acyltransferase domain protein [Mycobacterium kansasii 824]
MDRPNNLMVVDTVVWTADPLDWGRVREVLEERLINRYPVFRSLAVKDRDGSWWWELADDFDFGKHVTVVDLKDPADRRELQALVASHRTEMLDRTRPLWQGIWVDRYRDGSAMIVRTHHAVADGMRMVELSMSLFDASPAGGPIRGPASCSTPRGPTPGAADAATAAYGSGPGDRYRAAREVTARRDGERPGRTGDGHRCRHDRGRCRSSSYP